MLGEAYSAALENGEFYISNQRLAEAAFKRNSNLTKTNNPFLLKKEQLTILEPGEYVGWDDYKREGEINSRFKDNPKKLSFSDVF